MVHPLTTYDGVYSRFDGHSAITVDHDWSSHGADALATQALRLVRGAGNGITEVFRLLRIGRREQNPRLMRGL